MTTIDETRIIRETGDGLLWPPTAVFDLTRKFRYELTRTWSDALPWVWVMLNPSTADAMEDDATINRCSRRAKRRGAGGIIVVNLFAYRATRPAELARCRGPVGRLNDEFIRQAIAAPGRLVIAAWGADGTLHGRAARVSRMLTAAGIPIWCLGTTKDGQPVHPLYQPRDAELVPYRAPSGRTAA